MKTYLKPILVSGLGLTFAISGCGNSNVTNNDSGLKVVNGRPTTEGEFPAVVQISTVINSSSSARCTATWVSDSVIVTAAHCVDEAIGNDASRVSVYHGEGKGAKAKKIIAYPNWQRDHDMAVLVFEKETSKHWMAMTQRQAVVGDDMSIVGYGKYDHMDGRSGGVRRTGTNTVSDINSKGRISFDGYISPKDGDGTNVTNSQGDSGGPIIIENKFYGVSSTVSPNYPRSGENRGNYESVRAPNVDTWLTKLAEGDIHMVGFTAGTEEQESTESSL